MQESGFHALCQLIVTLAWQLFGMFTVIRGRNVAAPTLTLFQLQLRP